MFRGIKRGYEAVFFSTIGVGISPDNKHTTNYPHLLITALETSDRTLSRLWLLRNVFLQQREWPEAINILGGDLWIYSPDAEQNAAAIIFCTYVLEVLRCNVCWVPAILIAVLRVILQYFQEYAGAVVWRHLSSTSCPIHYYSTLHCQINHKKKMVSCYSVAKWSFLLSTQKQLHCAQDVNNAVLYNRNLFWEK